MTPNRATLVVFSLGFALVFAVVESFLVPLQIGTVSIPISVVGAVVLTPVLISWTYENSRSLALAALPGVVWMLVALAFSVRTPSGDVVIPATAVGTAFIVLGMLAAAIAWMLCYAKSHGSSGARR